MTEKTIMSDRNWFVHHRQDWIAETIRIFGFINREHIELKFGISTPQASMDLRHYQNEHPGEIKYNKSAKRYEASALSSQHHLSPPRNMMDGLAKAVQGPSETREPTARSPQDRAETPISPSERETP